MEAVRGYEEKRPEITRHLTSSYPRFVVHPFTNRLAAHWIANDPALAGQTLWLASSPRMAESLGQHLRSRADVRAFTRDGIHGVSPPAPDTETAAAAKLFLQHCGGFLSSREAEDHLVRLGLQPAPAEEAAFAGDAPAEIRRHLRRVLPVGQDADLLLCNCGMNAIATAFRTVSALQAGRGRTVWVQLGWLYLDTIALLKKFTATPADYVQLPDVFDRPALEKLFAERGDRIAGVISEVPTNPLVQTPDVPALAALCRKHGVRLLLDPSISSVYSLDLLAHADAVVSSLTKYTASEGTLVAGLVAINPAGPDANALRAGISVNLEPLYTRDAACLAAQIAQTEEVLAKIESNVGPVVAFLAKHPGVRDVYWAHHPASAANYRKLARYPGATGGMVTFTLRMPLARFYDRLRLPKGASFGMQTTLICPFMYLAHYDLVTSEEGRAELVAAGLEPDLLRLCLGTEPAADIIAALAEALA